MISPLVPVKRGSTALEGRTLHGFSPSVQVAYSGHVDWRSPGGTRDDFQESGDLETPYTRATIAPLTPETMYEFKVSALTEEGEGAEVPLFAMTTEAQGGKEWVESVAMTLVTLM